MKSWSNDQTLRLWPEGAKGLLVGCGACRLGRVSTHVAVVEESAGWPVAPCDAEDYPKQYEEDVRCNTPPEPPLVTLLPS